MDTGPLRFDRLDGFDGFDGLASPERCLRQIGIGSHPREVRAELGAELDLADGWLLEQIAALGVAPETTPAFEALPLVEVAWADGSVDPEERWRVLAAATAFGLELGRPAHAQLELWLSRRPPEVFFEAWRRFAAQRLSRPDAAPRARRVLEEARRVAAAAGGVLGFGVVSSAERASLERIRAALEGDAPPAAFL